MKQIVTLIRQYILPAGLYGAVIVLVFGRAFIPGVGEMIWGDDIHRSYYFYRQFFNNFLSQGIWPWWNPYNFVGAPFMANPIVNMLYPPSWLYVVLPLNLAYSWHIALHLLWAMMGMRTLLRRELSPAKRDLAPRDNNPIIQLSNEKKNIFFLRPLSYVLRPAIGPWLAGLIFGLSGFFTARIWAGHVDVIAAASWMPWVVGAFALATRDKGQETSKHIVIAAGVLAMQLFAGYQTMAMLTLEAVGIMTLITLITRRANTKTVVTVISSIALSVLLAIGLFAVVLLPQQEFFRQSIRTYSLPYFWNAYGSLTWQSLGQFFNPFFFGDQLTYAGPPPNFAEHAFFVGRTGLFFFIVTAIMWTIRPLLSSRRKPGSNFQSKMDSGLKAGMTAIAAFIAIAFFGLWVSMGPNAPIDLQYILWKTVPMYHFLRIPPRHLILVAFGLSGLIGFSMAHLTTLLSSRPLSRDPVYKLFRFFSMLLVALTTIEIIIYAKHFIALKPLPETRHDTQLIKILKQDTEPYRVLTNFGAWAPPRDSFDFDAGMQYGIFNATGYDTMILKPYYAYIDASNGATAPSILDHDVQIPYLNVFSKATDTLNIKYILHPRGYDPLVGSSGQAASRFKLIREDVVRDYRVYENTTVLPRFYFADPKEGKVEIEKYSPNEIILSTQSTIGATLMSSEMYYPGWEGFIDGKKVEIIKANNAFRALFVPAGRHTVIYRYNPRIFMIGGAISIVTLLSIVFWMRKQYNSQRAV